MGENTKIEWCHHTVNFWWGCAMAFLPDGNLSEECRNCYALMLSKVFSRGRATWGKYGKRWIRHEAARSELYKLDKSAFRRGVRERVFINSMSDTFEDRDDLTESREMLWGACQFVTNLDILLLTKRPENVCRMVPAAWLENWPSHVWIGTTCGTQQAADERIPLLLDIPASVRFLSIEPMLGPVDIGEDLEDQLDGGYIPGSSPIHWVICGGESGAKARPMHPDWVRSLRDQCSFAGVPFFFKQWGEWAPGVARLNPFDPEDPERYVNEVHWVSTGLTVGVYEHTKKRNLTDPQCRPHSFSDGDVITYRVGKKEAGRLLDGIEHNAFPEVLS